jgi:hypothetical protein
VWGNSHARFCSRGVRGDPRIDCNRLGAAIARRAQELVKAKLEAPANDQVETPTQSQAAPAMPDIPATKPALDLPEAPASVNCHILLEGRQVQVTLRDTDESRLLARLAALLRQYPPAQPPTQAAVQTPVCQWHGTMKESTKAKGTWYCSAKMADGSYCQSRHPDKSK